MFHRRELRTPDIFILSFPPPFHSHCSVFIPSPPISRINQQFSLTQEEEEEEMGRVFLVELDGKMYRCQYCRSHLALADDLVSRSFHRRRGKAYLFNNVVNITVGVQEERMMLSGMHTVADVFCCCCGQIVGWKYEAAHDKSQKYKEGKFVLERGRIVDGVDSEFYLNARRSGSDAEDV